MTIKINDTPYKSIFNANNESCVNCPPEVCCHIVRVLKLTCGDIIRMNKDIKTITWEKIPLIKPITIF